MAIRAALVALLLVLPASEVRAALVTWTMTGLVFTAPPELGSLGVFTYTPFAATITFDSSTLGVVVPVPGCSFCSGRVYENPVVAASFQAAGYSGALVAPITSQLDSGGGSNTFNLRAGPVAGSLADPSLELNIEASMGSTFPVTAPGDAFTNRYLYWDLGFDPSPANRLFGIPDAFTYTVPEPAFPPLAAFALLLAAIAPRLRG